MSKRKPLPKITITLEKIVGGGQALGEHEDGRKVFVWGGLPDETVEVQITKKKSALLEGYVTEVLQPSPERITPKDPESYLSTSPWQIMDEKREDFYKAALIEEAFELHNIMLPHPIEVYSGDSALAYRNKIEFSFWYDTETGTLDLAFFRRGTKGKIAVKETSLAGAEINATAKRVLQALNNLNIGGRDLKTLLVRSSASGDTAWQLYVKNEDFPADTLLSQLPDENGEVIYSNPKSPASVITKRLTAPGKPLTDHVLDVPFTYATEGFFQINLPVYEQALRDMKQWIEPDKPVVDMYSGVGTIGLTIGGPEATLVEINEHAVREMERNITALGIDATPVLAASEDALNHITSDKTIIVDPPRAGLHANVIDKLLTEKPARIIYLSCNPVTQARDVERLGEVYGVRSHRGYNFFPRTPHIEHLAILDLKP